MRIVKKLVEEKKAKEIEQLLPLAVYLAYNDALVGLSPQELISRLCNGFGALSNEMKKISSQVTRGMPLQVACKNLKTTSPFFRNFLNELIALDNGVSDASRLKKLANEVLSHQRAELKRYSSKSNLTGLFLISIGAVIPALFASISLLGSVIGFSLTAVHVFFAFLIVFPFFTLVLLLYADHSRPRVIT